MIFLSILTSIQYSEYAINSKITNKKNYINRQTHQGEIRFTKINNKVFVLHTESL